MTNQYARPATLYDVNGNPINTSNPLPVQLQTDVGAITANQGAAGSSAWPVTGSAVATNGSSTIASGGISQALFSGTVPSNGYEVINPDATNDLWISDTVTALANGTGNIRVGANGGTYVTPPGMRPINHGIAIVGAVTGQKFTAR